MFLANISIVNGVYTPTLHLGALSCMENGPCPVDCSIERGDFPWLFVCLPESTSILQ